MKKHTKVYTKYFDYGLEDFMGCEVCGQRAVDIHHIEARGMGGTDEEDYIENLMGLDRECHIKYGDKKQYINFLKEKHYEFMEKHKGIRR
jgi:hypothetical protein